MNARMKELLDKMRAKHKEAQAASAADKDKAAALLVEFGELKKEYDLEEQLFEAEKAMVPDFKDAEAKAKAGFEEKTDNGFSILAKKLKGKPLSDKEMDILTGAGTDKAKALVVDGGQGENLLIPEDVSLAINELRKSYKSAKELVNVIPTNGLTGSFNFEKGTPSGLVDFDDGDAIDASQEPEFEKKSFRIHFMGKMLYLSNILGQIEQAGLMAYINKWFVKNAIVTENKKIFKTIQVGTPKAVKGLDQLRQRVNRDLDPDAMIGARIVTNQTGFSIMDEEKDETGRPMLQPDPTAPTRMLFKGYPVEYFSDALLPNISSGKAPLFFGSLDAASYFIDLLGYQFAVSEHFRFDQNQNTMRVIEGFDNLLADKSAYLYCAFEEKEAAAEPPTP